ncbi:hypothetical protein GII36_02260 [Candidatus Mycosynbacter amalyticus]|uniref:Uncharacterized protein n=1 Tax=Candidatus Mycosynbacter amalyticus TaxID=2665156 RepID=A0A857MNF0_9BACT|nr:hypothetical protein [Candidatus Mycosynbacter amalyticus]QHN42671.1 hypothetical protein GII36_02260 [Candidatus Mycosynbacter amalyticus]
MTNSTVTDSIDIIHDGELIEKGQHMITQVTRVTRQMIVEYPAQVKFVSNLRFGSTMHVSPPTYTSFSQYKETSVEVDVYDMYTHAVVVSDVVTIGMHAGMRLHSRVVTEVYYISCE